ncbi:hypothetical protein FBEOM_8209 [Fusarium beomiforme]|uniref:Apple domain-containing protein n=1 Tax=Fusarium beomiforme TaxID=44412 RepID=A0A9P5AGL0_9HYPO|nr:hypothetical protein FBEOM_8209 [Fusarium beomiforme]
MPASTSSFVSETSIRTLIVNSETESTTSSTIESTSISEAMTTATEASTTKLSSALTETTTTTAVTTTAVSPEVSCDNQIYRGNALNSGYTTTGASSEQECWENCVDDERCNSWVFLTAGSCNLYTETLHQFSTPSNEEGLLIGSRNCSPRDYRDCNDEIGFGWTQREPDDQANNVLLEVDCAHLCMNNGLCDVWQYDGFFQTCNMFSGLFGDLVTLDSAGQGEGRKMLTGARSCSSDFFRPQLEACNGQMAWNNNWSDGYRRFDKYKTVATCARACSIDPMCLSWYLWVGHGDCEFSRFGLWVDPTDIATAGSRNCGVP